MRRLPVFLLPLLLLTVLHGAASTCEYLFGPGVPATESSFFKGMPLATDLRFQPTVVLQNIGFVVGYSDTYKNPLWVCYRLFATCPCDPRNREAIGFRNDPRTNTSVTDDFNWSVTDMDRGHHAPNSAISTCYGTQAQDETFLLTNISPQHKSLNEGIWKRLEALVLDYADAFGEVWVITGAILDPDDIELLNTPEEEAVEPALPKSFYKIIIRETSLGSGIDALAFIFPNKVPEHAAFEDYLESIEEIQSQTGLDVLWQLDDDTEEALEATPASSLWATLLVSPASAACASIVSINEFEANPAGSDTGHEWVELHKPVRLTFPLGAGFFRQ